MGSRLVGLFNDLVSQRVLLEEEWLKDERQYKGTYEPDELTRIKERDNASQDFLRTTRTKVLTMDARIADLVMGSGKKIWAIRPDANPDSVEEMLEEMPDQAAQAADQQENQQRAMQQMLAARAENMDAEIYSQFKHAKMIQLQRRVIHSGHKFGTGILKGPLATNTPFKRWTNRVPNWGAKGSEMNGSDAGPGSQATPSQADTSWQVHTEQRLTPFWEYVPVWDFYPEMDGWELENTEYCFQRHLFHKSDLLQLAMRGNFFRQAILSHVRAFPDGDAKILNWEVQLDTIGRYFTGWAAQRRRRYEVLEYWGPVDVEELRSLGKDVPEDMVGMLEAHVWFFPSTMTVIAADINPTAKVERPYSFYTPFPEEGHLFGESIPAICRDPQRLQNQALRGMMDNAASAVGPQIEMDVSRVPTAKNLKAMPPFRIWPVEPDPYGNNRNALNFNDLPNHTQMYLMLLQFLGVKFDEVSGIPAYIYGQTQGQGVGRTASGLSMLMGAAGLLLKNQLMDWDEFQERVVMLSYDWNMQFNPRKDIKGNFSVHVAGGMSLAMKEMRAEQIKQFRLSTNNPQDNQWLHRRQLLWAELEENELDPSKFVKTKPEMLQDMADMAKQQAAAAQNPVQLAMTLLTLRKKLADIRLTLSQADQASAKAGDVRAENFQDEIDWLNQQIDQMAQAGVPPLPSGGGDAAGQEQPPAAAGQAPAPAAGQPPMVPGPAAPTDSPNAAAGGRTETVPMPEFLSGLLRDSGQPTHSV